MESMHAVRVAMRVLALPMAGRNHAVAPMPPHVLEVLRIAARSPDTVQEWSNELRMPPDRLVEAANAFIQEVMMPPHASHYRVLGVEPDASMALIRTHYRWLAQGLQAGDAVANGWMLDRAGVAFEELSDPLKRSAYDQTLGAGGAARQYEDAEDLEPAPSQASPAAQPAAESADEDDTVEILALKPEEAGVDPDHWPDETGKFEYVPPQPEPVYQQPRNWLVPAGLALGIAAGVVLIIFILNPQPDLPPEPLATTEEALAEFETSVPNATFEPAPGSLPELEPAPELPPATESPPAAAAVAATPPARRPQAEARPAPPTAQVAAPARSRPEPEPVRVQPPPEPAPEPVVQAPPPPPAPVLDPAALARSARPLVERFRDAWTAGDFLTVLNVLGDGGGMGSAALAPIAGDVQRWRRERPGQSLEITGLALVNSDDPASPRMVATLSTPDGAGMRLSLRQVNGLWRATGLVKIGGAASP